MVIFENDESDFFVFNGNLILLMIIDNTQKFFLL